MSFPISPGINVTETSLIGSVPAIATSVGGLVGRFAWGPVNFITPISNQTQLAAQFSKPDNTCAEDWFTAANFLGYSNNLNLVRAQGSGMLNATGSTTGIAIEIDNPQVYFNTIYSTTLASNNYIARYPGALGNSIGVITFANGAAWTAAALNPASPYYTYANYFSWAPNTTPYVTQVTNGQITGDEVHILVVDQGGLITGTANSVLERYQGLSRLSNALDSYGNNNYYKEVLWQDSQYIYNVGVPSSNVIGWGNTIAQQLGTGAFGNDLTPNVAVFANGSSGNVQPGNVIAGMALLSDPTYVQINLLMTGYSANLTVQNYAIQDVAAVRKDCVAFCSAPLYADQNTAMAPVQAVLAWAANVAYSSYAFLDTGYKYQYDQYNNVYRWIPLNGDMAGLCARTDMTNAPWWSPAGLQRGVINNVVKLAYNPGLSDRNSLYPAGINPVVTLPGSGTLLYGDVMHLNYDSAFSHINVRRLFIVLEQQISLASQASLFEFNDTFTRAQFVALMTPYLRTVQGQRGITSFNIRCDSTNNTDAVINANQFVGSIYVVPNKSINFICLNFIAVPTGVSFSTVVGQVGVGNS